jgi:hypothetical protein
MKLLVIAFATAPVPMRRALECPNQRLGLANQWWVRRQLLIQERPPDRRPSPFRVLGHRMEQRPAPVAVQTPIACRRELRAERAGLQASLADCACPSAAARPHRPGSVASDSVGYRAMDATV